MKTEGPHFSYPKRDGYFTDTRRMGRVPEAPMAIDVPFDLATDQGDLAPVVRKVNSVLFFGVLVMIGWVAGCLMALAMLKGVW